MITDNTARHFYEALIEHIYKVLCERDEKIADEDQWILTEALSAAQLCCGGTFRNVLSRKIDNEIVPIFSGMLDYIDQACNLDLLVNGSEEIKKLWLKMFTDADVMTFHFSLQGKGLQLNEALLIGSVIPKNYKCGFPFFWLIKHGVETELQNLQAGMFITAS